jgi:hypothetical protein
MDQPQLYNQRRDSGESGQQREHDHFNPEGTPPFGASNQSRTKTLEQENLELRKALNWQLRENNELLKRVRFLEMQNQELRNQLGGGLDKSKGLWSTQQCSTGVGGEMFRSKGMATYPYAPGTSNEQDNQNSGVSVGRNHS